MKKLYALLIILIVIYVGINIGNLDFNFSGDILNFANDGNVADAVDESIVSFGASSFPKFDNFTDNVVDNTTVSLFDENKNMTINVSEIDNSRTIKEIANDFYSNNVYTSSQLIDQNGVDTYFLYNEVTGHYSSDIFFNKNGQNYRISGEDIPYSNSDYFINHCKDIIDTMNITSIE